MYPPTIAIMKKAIVLITTVPGCESGFLKPITKVRTIIPITSSMIAALTMVVPTLLLILPSSCRTATVILTLVAVIMVPMKTAL